MPVKVIDASVMASWCFRESRSLEAAGLLQEAELHAPVLLAYELTSIARRKVTTYPGKAREINEALRIALSVPIKLDDVNHVDVLELALKAGITTYDACYLYLAQVLDGFLVTFDQKLIKAAMLVKIKTLAQG
jgi:predicted nucleic acid-binding protein